MQLKLSESVAARRRIPLKLLDATDGIAEETGLTPAATLSKNGAAFAAGTGSITGVNGTGQNGSYYYEASAADLDTLGYLEVRVTDAAARTFYALVQVIAQDLYADSIGSVVGSVGSIAAGGITAASIATDAITAGKIAAGAITAAATSADFVTELTAAIDAVLSLAHGAGSWEDAGGGGGGATAAEVWQHVIEGTLTAEQLVRLISSALFANASGLEGSAPIFRDLANTKNRITASYSGGTRIVATRDGT
jgi:hypothetical protein